MPTTSGEATAILRAYESPEIYARDVCQLDAENLFAGDFWAFCVIIHELLTKTMPFDSKV